MQGTFQRLAELRVVAQVRWSTLLASRPTVSSRMTSYEISSGRRDIQVGYHESCKVSLPNYNYLHNNKSLVSKMRDSSDQAAGDRLA
jgi:hypothetical protein